MTEQVAGESGQRTLLSLPSQLLNTAAIAIVGDHVTDYICIHAPVVDEHNIIVDGRLEWWNLAYEQIRTTTVVAGQSLMATYFEPETALGFFRRAFDEGSASQIFEYHDTADRYRPPAELVRIRVEWFRLGSYVVEVGSDVSRVTMLELDLQERELSMREAAQQRLRAADRERIARDLHDSVIQQLFATELFLQLAAGQDEARLRAAVADAVQALDLVIADIRNTIFEISSDHDVPLEQRIREVVSSIAMWLCPVELECSITVEPNVELADDAVKVVLEALSNVVRHSQAEYCVVRMNSDADALTISVVDNGIGMPKMVSRSSGVSNMGARARERGGSFELQAGPGGVGTQLEWSVPMEALQGLEP